MISQKIEGVLKTFSAHLRAGSIDLVTLTRGCNILQDCAAQVRAMEERGGPVDYDASEADLETIRHHFADLIDPDPRHARLRD